MDIGTDLTVQDLRALAELETRIPQEEVLLVHNMAPLVDLTKTVSECGVEEGDIIVASRVEGGVAQTMPGSSQPPAVLNNPGHPPNQGSRPVQRQQAQQDPENPETIRQHFLNNPYELSLLRQRNPPLAEALLSGDRERFRDALERQRRAVRDAERERIRILNADPLDPDYQAKIARDIQEKNIAENMEAAIEYTPESFSHVVMLYLDIRVNGVLVRALVDSGARTTVMSQACAERCNIMRLVDRRCEINGWEVGVWSISTHSPSLSPSFLLPPPSLLPSLLTLSFPPPSLSFSSPLSSLLPSLPPSLPPPLPPSPSDIQVWRLVWASSVSLVVFISDSYKLAGTSSHLPLQY